MARPRSDIPERIVRAARARFLADGVDGASQRQIARDAGTNLGMVYYYYPTKDALFLAVVEDVYGRLLADIALALAPGVSVHDRLRRMFARFGALSDDELDVVRIIVREVLFSAERRRLILARFATGHLPLLLETLAEGIGSGELRDTGEPFPLVVSAVAIGLFPQVVGRVAGRELGAALALPSGDRLAEISADLFLHGAVNRAARAPAPGPAATPKQRARTRKK